MAPDDVPAIRLTSLMGSKGLQAEHIFLAAFNGSHFPRDNDAPTNVEVSQLLVALTRARKSCTLVSTRRLGQTQLEGSVFAEWLAPHVVDVYVDKEYLDAHEW
jgi:superfamily I DNA/RNA helicase